MPKCVTNVEGEATALYDALYCQRGEAENRIKETQLDLFGARASCHKFLASQFRQSELIPVLQVKMFIVAGLLDAVTMIGVGIALYLLFANPFLGLIAGR